MFPPRDFGRSGPCRQRLTMRTLVETAISPRHVGRKRGGSMRRILEWLKSVWSELEHGASPPPPWPP